MNEWINEWEWMRNIPGTKYYPQQRLILGFSSIWTDTCLFK